MSSNTDIEAATLMAFMPWLKHDEAMHLLNNFGGDAESVMNHLEEVASSADARQEPQAEPKPLPKQSASNRKVERHFVGGGPSSGQAVLAGDEADATDNVKSLVDGLFEKARQNDAERSNPDLKDDAALHMFAGRGRRLGHTTMDSPFIATSVRHQRTVAVAIYRNGYRVDDGPLLKADTQEGKAFFRDLQSGVVPISLATAYPDTDISVNLSDCMDQDYKPPAYIPFSGEGCRLSEPTGPAQSEGVSNAGASSVTGEFKIYEGEETARIAIINFLGERKEHTVNPKRHTVADVFILAKQAQPAAALFKLIVRDVPPRPLVDKSITIDDAKLRNATVMMRPV